MRHRIKHPRQGNNSLRIATAATESPLIRHSIYILRYMLTATGATLNAWGAEKNIPLSAHSSKQPWPNSRNPFINRF